MDRVLLINMPFSFFKIPTIGISLLKSALEKKGIACDIRYFNMDFAAWLAKEGLDPIQTYDGILQRARLLQGEWIFSPALFGERKESDRLYTDEWVRKQWAPLYREFGFGFEDEFVTLGTRIRKWVEPFLDYCLQSVDWGRYRIVGFTSTFQQNLASLALAKQIKAKYPEKIIIFGGPNCESVMGDALHRLFPFIDIVCSGESDWLFPQLVDRLIHDESFEDLPHIVSCYKNQNLSTMGMTSPQVDLNELPYPDYDDYFHQLESSSLASLVQPDLLFESSRGCWWGEKSQCTFCGMSGGTIKFRRKSKDRVLDELSYLSQKYKIKNFITVDNILDMTYFKDLLPELRNLHLQLWYEIKSNLTKDKVFLLKKAGIGDVQPGIETLSTEILCLMKKGTTAIQNIQFLKWAQEAGVWAGWTFLLGFPGEDPEEYPRMAEIIRTIPHLQPPCGCSLIRLDRFSPYFNHPEELGICRVRPLEVYRYIYPFDDGDLYQLAYFFDYDYADGRNPLTYVRPVIDAVEEWKRHSSLSLTCFDLGSKLLIRDGRPNSRHLHILLKGAQKEIYEFCDQARSLSAIKAHVKKHFQNGSLEKFLHYIEERCFEPLSTTDLQGDVLELKTMLEEESYQRELESFLDQLLDLKLILREGKRYLSLAVHYRKDSPKTS